MKIHTFAALFTAFAITASAQEGPFLAPALLIEKEGAFQKVWLMVATNSEIRYRETEVAIDSKDARISDYASIYVFEPREYAAAMDLYQARKYEEAKAKFIAVKERYKPIQPMENSPAVMAAFYEMECLRKLGDLDGLAKALQTFTKASLTRQVPLGQLDLYVLWDAVRSKSWDRLDILARERDTTRLPGDQRAQVAYCHGLALEGLNRPKEALFAYETAMTADAGASEVIVRNSALRVLAIHHADPAVQQAISVWDSPDENKNSKGYADLTEAAAVAELFELSLGAGTPLPAEYKNFLKFKVDPDAPVEAKPKAKDEPKPEAKPTDEAAKAEAKPEAKPKGKAKTKTKAKDEAKAKGK
jgi:tetratricopeptide (TPR) repeat protein